MSHDGLLSVDGKVLLHHFWQFHGDVRKHSVIIFPLFLGGVHVESGAGAKVPAVLLPVYVAATCIDFLLINTD